MIKIFGCFMVVLGCAGLGWMKSFQLQRNGAMTTDFIDALAFMLREITEKHRELPYLLEKLGKKENSYVGDYFRQLAQDFHVNYEPTFSERWTDSITERLELPQSLVNLLLPLGGVLGQYDAEKQGQAILQVIDDLRGLKESQKEEFLKMRKVYGVVGVTSGIFLVILLS